MKAPTTLIGLFIVIATAVFPADGSQHTLPDRHTAIFGADDATAAKIQVALSLYAAADLELPALLIYVHETEEGCNGHPGIFNKDGSGHRVDICDMLLLSHELAHAWELHNMDEATRLAFMEEAGLSNWNDPDTDHDLRGIEQAAKAIAIGVSSGPIGADVVDLYHDQLDTYELLTGKPSPRIAHLAAGV
jgi:hypothetical protein